MITAEKCENIYHLQNEHSNNRWADLKNWDERDILTDIKYYAESYSLCTCER